MAKFKVPDLERDRELLSKKIEKYVEDLKSGAIGPEDISPRLGVNCRASAKGGKRIEKGVPAGV
ncbi:MAG: hypothetical protein NTX30_23375 [Deltaproteobacteria bacterium]|nr:hypothetical protein [Deltaproteobacteria bacterium]